MKIALIYGKGIDGCGVTKCGVEMQKYCLKNDIQCDIFAYNKKFDRRDSHIIENLTIFNDDVGGIDFINKLNKYDIVIFHSYPSSKNSKDYIFNFYNMVKKVSTIKVGFMHELNKTNIDKVPFLLLLMNEMDTIYNFSESTWFAKTISGLLKSKVISERIKKFTMFMNFEEFDKIGRTRDRDFNIRYIGRWTSMKDPRRLYAIHNLFKKESCEFPLIQMVGIERSHGALFDVLMHENCLDFTKNDILKSYREFLVNEKKKSKEVVENYVNDPWDYDYKNKVAVLGTYEYSAMVKLLSKTLFGASFYALKDDNICGYGDRMEYTQIEIIACGAIPLFDRHWGEHNCTKDGIRFIDIPYSAVYVDKDNLSSSIAEMIKIKNDIELQNKYRRVSYELVKKEYDINVNINEFFDTIIKNGIDKNKFTSEHELVYSITNNAKLTSKLISNLETKDELPVFGIRELQNKIYSIEIDGKQVEKVKYGKK